MLWKIVSTGKRIVDIDGYMLKPFETIIIDPTTLPSYTVNNILSYKKIGLIKIYEQEGVNNQIEEPVQEEVVEEPQTVKEPQPEPTPTPRRGRKTTNKESEE